jgi:hypothetical protein
MNGMPAWSFFGWLLSLSIMSSETHRVVGVDGLCLFVAIFLGGSGPRFWGGFFPTLRPSYLHLLFNWDSRHVSPPPAFIG